MTKSSAPSAPELGLRIVITPLKTRARWVGTRAQLEAEGFVPADQEWPQGVKPTSWKLGSVSFYIHRVKTQPAEATGGNELFQVTTHYWDVNYQHRNIAAKAKELAAALMHGGPQWSAAWNLHYQARIDSSFQAFKRDLLGQKRRGRPTKSHQGASA